MKRVSKLYRLSAAAGFLVVAATASAQPITEEEKKRVDERFEIASEHVAKGNIQAQARSEDGEYTVYSFDCDRETYDVVFEGQEAPADFPVRDHAHSGETLDRTTDTGAIAAHACDKHGQPLLGWEW